MRRGPVIDQVRYRWWCLLRATVCRWSGHRVDDIGRLLGCCTRCMHELEPDDVTHYTAWGWHPASACDAWPECPQRDARGDA